MPLRPDPCGVTFDRIAFDVIGPLERTNNGNRFILLVTDYFSKFTDAYSLPDHTANRVAWTLLTRWVKYFGCPRLMHCDRAPEFEGLVISDLCKMLEVQKTRTTPYHPQSDGQAERNNRTLESMLAAMVNDNRNNWDEYVDMCIMAFNATPHEATGASPHLLVFGQEKQMPIDVLFDTTQPAAGGLNIDADTNCYCNYVETLRHRMKDCHERVRLMTGSYAERMKKYYNTSLRPFSFHVGEWILRWHPPSKKQTLGRGWVGPYVITRKISDLIYEIQAGPDGPRTTIHANDIRHCKSFEGIGNWIKDANQHSAPGVNNHDKPPGHEDERHTPHKVTNDDDEQPQRRQNAPQAEARKAKALKDAGHAPSLRRGRPPSGSKAAKKAPKKGDRKRSKRNRRGEKERHPSDSSSSDSEPETSAPSMRAEGIRRSLRHGRPPDRLTM